MRMKPALRVMQLITELRPAGAERIVYHLARDLPAQQFRVQVCSLRPAVGAVSRWLHGAGIAVHSLNMSAARKVDPLAPLRLAALLRAERIELLHCHLFHAGFIGRWAARLARTPALVSTVHIVERRFRPWRFWLDRLTLRSDEVIVCVSDAVRRFIHRRTGIAEHRLRVIHNGVDLERAARAAEPYARRAAAERVRRELGLDPDAPLVVAVGRLEPQKGYHDLIAAWVEVRRNSPARAAPQLLIAGEGSERRALAALRRSQHVTGCVHLLGHRDDVPALLAAADLFVLSSHYEGFGLVVAEAMAAGLPVVATAVDSIPEVLGDGGAGVLAPPGDPPALANAIRRVLALPRPERARMGAIGERRAREKFSLPAMLHAYGSLYQELVPDRRPARRTD